MHGCWGGWGVRVALQGFRALVLHMTGGGSPSASCASFHALGGGWLPAKPTKHAASLWLCCLLTAVTLPVPSPIRPADFLASVTRKGELLRAGLRDALAGNPHVQEVRGLGLICGVQLGVPAGPLVAAARERGVIVITAGKGDIVRLVPPLVVRWGLDAALMLCTWGCAWHVGSRRALWGWVGIHRPLRRCGLPGGTRRFDLLTLPQAWSPASVFSRPSPTQRGGDCAVLPRVGRGCKGGARLSAAVLRNIVGNLHSRYTLPFSPVYPFSFPHGQNE
jgi:hypothetical protein